MRNLYKNIALALLVAVGLTSCKDWLDATSKTQLREEEQFNSIQGFQQALYGCYVGLISPSDDSEGLYSQDLMFLVPEFMAQQYSVGPQNTYVAFSQYKYNTTHSSDVREFIWLKSYNTIANLNNLLKYTEVNRDVLDNINYNVIRGEALAMRAFLHFDLMRMFGRSNLAENPDVDINTTLTIPYKTELDKDIVPQKSYAATLALIIKDLSEALTLLENYDPVTGVLPTSAYAYVNQEGFFNNRQQRFNYYAAKAILARVYMWYATPDNLDSARALAVEVLTDAQNNGVVKWVTTTASLNNDPLMSAEHLLSFQTTNQWYYTMNYFISAPTSNTFSALYLDNPKKTEIFEGDAADLRASSGALLPYDMGSMVHIPKKFLFTPLITPTGGITNTYSNLPIVKLSEMYYIAAECLARKSNTYLSSASRYLETVRAIRGLTTPIPVDTKEELLEAIGKEYKKEFLCEGQMFYYYKRTGATAIPGAVTVEGDMSDQEYMLPYPSSEKLFNRVQ